MFSNQLSFVPEELLAPLVSLELLMLQDNGITEIPFGFFDNCPSIANIIINENLQGFCKTVFDNLINLHDIDLESNPCMEDKNVFSFENYIDYWDMLDDLLWNAYQCEDTCPF